MNVNTYGAKSSEMCRGSCADCCLHQCWNLLSLSAETLSVNGNHSSLWLLLIRLAFLLCSWLSLCTQLCQSGWGKTEARPLCDTLKGQRSWLFNPLFFSWWRELFLYGKFLVLKSASLQDGMIQSKWNQLPSLPVWLFSIFLFYCVAEFLKQDSRDSPELVSFVDSRIMEICGGRRVKGLLRCHFGLLK